MRIVLDIAVSDDIGSRNVVPVEKAIIEVDHQIAIGLFPGQIACRHLGDCSLRQGDHHRYPAKDRAFRDMHLQFLF